MIKLLFIFLFISCAEKEIEKQPLPNYTVKEKDLEMINLINQYRAQNNKRQLLFRQDLCNIASTVKECNHNYFTDRAEYFHPMNLSECIACGYSTPSASLNGLKNSQEHNEILLDNTLIYIGVASKTGLITIEFLK